jgi:SAM-dependent methyltransferase
VLDVGGASGYVGDAFRAAGAKAVTAEYDFDQMTEHGRTVVDGVIADGCDLPIATGAVDISYTSNVLEHVISYQRMLAEMVRVVAPGGVIYLTFTNWLSPWGGHETSPWHYLGGEWSARRFERKTGAPPKNRFGVSLFRLDVRDVLAWCESCSWSRSRYCGSSSPGTSSW